MDFHWVVDNDAARWVSAAAGTIGAYLGFKNYRQRVKENQMAAEQAQAAEARALNERFEKKADMEDFERLAGEVSGKADATVTARDTKRHDGEIMRLRQMQGTMFDQIRDNDKAAQARHNAVMEQLLTISQRLPAIKAVK